MRKSARLNVLILPLLAAVLFGCAPPAGTTAPGAPAPDPGAVRWTVAAHPHIDLWYHGLALTGFGEAPVLPIYQPDYPAQVQAAKRGAGITATPLDQQAADLARRFAAEPRYTALQFLPLYFPTGEMLFTAIRAWGQVEGDPRRVQDPTLAQMVAFLAQQFPTAEQRRVVGGWVELLEEEQRLFFGRYRAERMQDLGGVQSAVQARWDPLADRLRPLLDYLILNQGELTLSFPLGPEGRTLNQGRQNNRVAVGIPDPADPSSVVWAFLHELMYPLVAPVVQDQLSPAQRREVDEQRLTIAAAVRAGAIVLDRLSPEDAPAYRAAYLRWVGAAVPAAAAQRDAAMARAFPIPDPLPRAIADAVDVALQGI